MAPIGLKRLCEQYLQPVVGNFSPTPADSPRAIDLDNNFEHEPFTLALASVEVFGDKKYEDLQKRQQDAITHIKLWIEASTGSEIVALRNEKIKCLVLSFGELFFAKDLDSFEIRFENLEPSEPDGPVGFGQSTHSESLVSIVIDPRDHSEALHVEDHKTALLSTILQEIILANFSSWCCGKDLDSSREECQCGGQGDEKWWDHDDHFSGWFLLAAGIDINANQLLDLELDLSVFRSLTDAYDVSNRAKRLDAEDWEVFFRRYFWDDVDSLVKKLQEDEFDQLGKLLAGDELEVIDVFMSWYREMDDDASLVTEAKREELRARHSARWIKFKLEYCMNR